MYLVMADSREKIIGVSDTEISTEKRRGTK